MREEEAKLPKMKRMTVTPTMAAKWLKKNRSNRNLRPSLVDKYCSDMLAKRWTDIGQPILLSPSGELLDGQHRLHACVKANVSFVCYVYQGVRSVNNVDIGATRDLADTLKMEGMKHATMVASTLRLIWNVDTSGKRTRTGSHEELKVIFKRNKKELGVCAEEAQKLISVARNGAGALSPSVVCFLLFVFRKKDEDLASLYVEQLEVGVNLKQTDPAYRIRARITKKIRERTPYKSKEIVIMCAKGWNSIREGTSFSKAQLVGRDGKSISWKDAVAIK
jgi:hypothetical protein